MCVRAARCPCVVHPFCVWGAVSGSVTRQRPVRPGRSHAYYSQVVTSGGRSGRWWTRFERRLRTSSLTRRTRVARHCALCCACFVRGECVPHAVVSVDGISAFDLICRAATPPSQQHHWTDDYGATHVIHQGEEG